MKTADLIADLANAAAPVAPASPGRRLAATILAGGVLALAVLLPWLGLRPLGVAVRLPSFWMKGVYTTALAVAAWVLAARLSRPSGGIRAPLVAILAIVLFMVSMGAMDLARTPAVDLPRVWLGASWDQCPFNILVLAIPVFVLGVIAVRRLAPTRLVATGGALGLMAGAAAATVYGLHCDESTAAFTATWYTLGIGACAGIGALLGPRLLRW
jgi:hypothetical protein